MGLSQALYTGVSGLITHNRCMDNIGNNIANVNTTGFKKGVFQFTTILEQAYRGGNGGNAAANRGSVNPIAVGLGATTGSINKDFTQGPMDTTNNPKHMGIVGNGFFAVQVGDGMALTRDGNFYLGSLQVGNEKQTVLMAAGGLPVLGYRADEYGNLSTSAPLESLAIEIGATGGALQTGSATFGGNLDSSQIVAMGTRIVGGGMTNPPPWLGRDLNTADSTWPALDAAAAAGTPGVVNGGNVMTSGALGVEAWRIRQSDLDNFETNGVPIATTMLERVHISADASLNDGAYAYYAIDSGADPVADRSAVARTLNGGGVPAAAPANGLDTNLRDLFYHDGTTWQKPFSGIQNGDGITITWQVGASQPGAIGADGGARTVTATFVYNHPGEEPFTLNAAQSFTLEHWTNFLAGDVDSPTLVAAPLRHGAGAAPGVYAGFLFDGAGYATVNGAGEPVYVDARNRLVNAAGDFVDPDGATTDPATGQRYTAETAYRGFGLYGASEDAGAVVTDAGWRIDPATLRYLDAAGQPVENPSAPGAYFAYGDDTASDAFRQAVDLLTVRSDPSFDPAGAANERLVGGAMGLVKLAPKISAENGGADPYDAPAESAGAYTRRHYDDLLYNTGDLAAAPTFNLSLVGNLGLENALSNISVSFRNVAHNNLFGNDQAYYEAEGGGAATTDVVYDSLGTTHPVTLRLTLVSRDNNFSTWRWIADSPADTDNAWGADENGNLDTNAFCGTGLIRFDADGRFVPGDELSETGGIEITRELNGTNTPIRLALAEGASSHYVQALNFRGLTQKDTGKTSNFGVTEQDGRAPGEMTGFTVAEDGTITGTYDNGLDLVLGRLALAMVTNDTGLVAAGGNLFYASAASGPVQIGPADTGGRGVIKQGQLETSNVELAEEFTKLITTERGYQANARTISTVDEMLQELLNLKR